MYAIRSYYGTFVFRKVSNSKFHNTNIIPMIDEKNEFKYNHAFEVSKHIQSELCIGHALTSLQEDENQK